MFVLIPLFALMFAAGYCAATAGSCTASIWCLHAALWLELSRLWRWCCCRRGACRGRCDVVSSRSRPMRCVRCGAYYGGRWPRWLRAALLSMMGYWCFDAARDRGRDRAGAGASEMFCCDGGARGTRIGGAISARRPLSRFSIVTKAALRLDLAAENGTMSTSLRFPPLSQV